MKISDFASWYQLVALTSEAGKMAVRTNQSGELNLLFEKNKELLADRQTSYVKIIRSWNGKENLIIKADWKQKRWDLFCFDLKLSEDVPSFQGWSDSKKLIERLKELDQLFPNQ